MTTTRAQRKFMSPPLGRTRSLNARDATDPPRRPEVGKFLHFARRPDLEPAYQLCPRVDAELRVQARQHRPDRLRRHEEHRRRSPCSSGLRQQTSASLRSVGVTSSPCGLRPPMRAISPRPFAAQPDAPSASNASTAASIASRAARFFTAPTPDDAQREQCPRAAERVADGRVLSDRTFERAPGRTPGRPVPPRRGRGNGSRARAPRRAPAVSRRPPGGRGRERRRGRAVADAGCLDHLHWRRWLGRSGGGRRSDPAGSAEDRHQLVSYVGFGAVREAVLGRMPGRPLLRNWSA